jgi:hypothetical protein
VKSDPFAPATSSTHIKNLNRAELPEPADTLDDIEREALLRMHTTGTEAKYDKLLDDAELERRDTLVREYREELAEHGEAQNPTLVDLVNEEYVWQDGDEDSPPGWMSFADREAAVQAEAAEFLADPVETPAEQKPAKPARKGAKGSAKPAAIADAEAELEAAVAELDGKAGK